MKMGGDKVFIQVYYLNKLHEKLKKSHVTKSTCEWSFQLLKVSLTSVLNFSF